MHPVRSTKSTWTSALNSAIDANLNMISLYTFWSYHQPLLNFTEWRLPGGDWTLADAIRDAGCHGFFVYLRIGPYVCAEYNYGGIPPWLGVKEPGMEMRRYDPIWMGYMQHWVGELTEYITDNELWADQGGPVILAQIENELGYDTSTPDAQIEQYANWCGDLAHQSNPNIVWTMCNGLSSPRTVVTCNGYGEDGACSTSWLEEHGQNSQVQITQPAIWTEDEGGFQIWGDDPLHPSDYFWGRTAREMSRDLLQFVARGGSLINYYMFFGGYNRDRAAASGIQNAYAVDALLCNNAVDRHEPKFDHLARLHRVISEVSFVLMNAPTALNNSIAVEYWNPQTSRWEIDSNNFRMFLYEYQDTFLNFVENDSDGNVTIRFHNGNAKDIYLDMPPTSSSLLLNHTLAYNSADIAQEAFMYSRKTVSAMSDFDWLSWRETIESTFINKNSVIRGSTPMEQTKLAFMFNMPTDYAWYQTTFSLSHTMTNATLEIDSQKGNALSIFINETLFAHVDNHEHAEANTTFSMKLGNVPPGQHTLVILSESLGYHNLIGRWGYGTHAKVKGITGDVILSGDDWYEMNLVKYGNYTWWSRCGLQNMTYPNDARHYTAPEEGIIPPATWSMTSFDTPAFNPSTQSLMLDVPSLGRGTLWINGHNLGRYWNMTQASNSTKYSQRYYHVPNDFLVPEKNELVVFSVTGGDLLGVNLLLTWIEKESEVMVQDGIETSLLCL